MVYLPTNWVDEVLAGAERYDIKDNVGATINLNTQISLATAVSVAGTPVNAAAMNNIEAAIVALMNRLLAHGGRLTLESGVPISTTDQTAKTTLYFTPYMGSHVSIFNGTTWEELSFTELSLSLAAYTASKPYDIFLINTGGVVSLESCVWTNATTRATALALQDGTYCKSGNLTRLYAGTIYTSATGQCEDSKLKRYVWNYYNRLQRQLSVTDGTASWSYNGGWRQVRATASNCVSYVCGLTEDLVYMLVQGAVTQTAQIGLVGVGVDVTNANSCQVVNYSTSGGWVQTNPLGIYEGYPGIGFHTLNWIEYSNAALTFYGTGSGGVSGMNGYVMG